MSFVTRHTSHVTRHTSHVTRHTSHITRHTSHTCSLTFLSTSLHLRQYLNKRCNSMHKIGCNFRGEVLVACNDEHGGGAAGCKLNLRHRHSPLLLSPHERGGCKAGPPFVGFGCPIGNDGEGDNG